MVFSVVAVVLIWASLAVGEEVSLKSAPLNPEFIKYLERLEPAERNFGLIPLPVDLGKHKRESFKAKVSLPSRYDLRNRGLLTSVKDQGSYGTCWAFATYGSLESHLLLRGRGSYDFSERNLINLCGYDDPWNKGGNILKSMAYLSRGSGPVPESQDPYILGPGSSPILDGTLYVENAVVLPGREDVYDNDYIKEAIYIYGGVYASMYYDKPFFNSSAKTYYCGVPGYISNHAVVLVGW
ncbi:MAG: surface layer protein B, partial [Synergistetes bacterium]|nr:surface layer protein B [Synergistota bacterium]MDW8191583.1 C1 family peptidase [Synergistota bacterium]